jgi:capsular polysaccharide export protein
MELARDLPDETRSRLYADSFPRQALWDMRFHLANLERRRFPHYERFLLHHPVPTYLGTGLQLLLRWPNRMRAALKLRAFPSAVPLWLFAMQMETDYSIRAYSRFADMDQAIDECIAAFAATAPADAGLLVKVHPLDPCLKSWRARVARMARAHGVARRVHYLGSGDLDTILRRCRGVVTVNSTVGIRALQLGVPVHAMGEAIYRVPGLSHLGPLPEFWDAQPAQPALAQAFLRGIEAHLHVRGTYYAEPGLTAGVEAAAERLAQGRAGVPEEFAAPLSARASG